MGHISNEKALAKIGNYFILTTLLSERVKELRQGAKPLLETDAKNPVEIALMEIALGKISYTIEKEEDE